MAPIHQRDSRMRAVIAAEEAEALPNASEDLTVNDQDAEECDQEETALANGVRNRKVQFRFDVDGDKQLAKEVLAHNPFEADFGSVGSTWDRVVDTMGVGIDGRRCRERVKLLVANRKRRVAALEKGSGIEEYVPDLDALIDEIVTVEESANMVLAERKQEQKDSAEKAGRIAEEIRQRALEGMKPREKRNREDNSLLSFLESRRKADVETKRLKLALEERRLELEERRHDLAEQRAALETQERVAMINLLAAMSAKTSAQ